MPFPRLVTPSLAKAAPLLMGVVLFAAACSGGDSSDAFTAAVEAASQADSTAAATDNSTTSSSSAATDAPLTAEEADQQRYEMLLQGSDRFAQTPVGDGGRIAIGVDCLDGFSTPTAIVTILGQRLPVGMHEGTATPRGRVTLNVFAEQVQDLPAGSSFYAAQSGYEADEYVYTFASLGGATVTLGGCE